MIRTPNHMLPHAWKHDIVYYPYRGAHVAHSFESFDRASADCKELERHLCAMLRVGPDNHVTFHLEQLDVAITFSDFDVRIGEGLRPFDQELGCSTRRYFGGFPAAPSFMPDTGERFRETWTAPNGAAASVQASDQHYCTPKKTGLTLWEYSAVEVGVNAEHRLNTPSSWDAHLCPATRGEGDFATYMFLPTYKVGEWLGINGLTFHYSPID